MTTPQADDAVEIFLRIASARNALDAALSVTAESSRALENGDIPEALERFGVAHEYLRETSMLAKGFPDINQVARILESTHYRKLLAELGDLESRLVSRCACTTPTQGIPLNRKHNRR